VVKNLFLYKDHKYGYRKQKEWICWNPGWSKIFI
jgi:hypothetical protein